MTRPTPRTRPIIAALALLAAPASAQDLTHTAPPQSEPIALLGGTVHPVSGPAIEDGLVLFEEGTITAVAPAATVRLADNVRVIDCTGNHIYPGVFAANTRVGLTEIESVRPMRDFDEVGELTPEARACVSINPDSTLFPVARTNGVLTVLTLPAGGLVPGRASVLRTDGWTWEDMTIAPDAGLVVNWPRIYRAPNTWTGRAEDAHDDSIDTLTNLVDAARAYHAIPPEQRTTDIRLDALADYLNPDDQQRPLIISADSIDQLTSAVQWADQHQLRIIILGGRDAPLCATLLKEHKVPVILRGTHGMPARSDAPFDQPFTRPADLEAVGVTWCLAPSDIDANVRNLAYEAASAVAYGLDQHAALRSITLAPAQVLGLADRLGSLEQGKAATIIVTDGPLLEITTNTLHAFIDGRQVDLSNKQTELRDKYREKYRQLDLINDD